MKKILDSEKLNKYEREFHWLARISAIIYIILISIFPIDTPISTAGSWTRMIPSLLILIALIVSWRHELAGVVIFICLALASIGFLDAYKTFAKLFLIILPLFLIAILFLIDFHAKKKHLKEMKDMEKSRKKAKKK